MSHHPDERKPFKRLILIDKDIPIKLDATRCPLNLSLTPAPLTCTQLLMPENEIDFAASAKATFSWTEMPSAASYVLTFIFPADEIVTFESDSTEIVRYIDAFTPGGTYQWNVNALNAAGEELCQSDFFTFTKGVSEIAPEESAPQDHGNDGGGDGSSCPPDCGGNGTSGNQ